MVISDTLPWSLEDLPDMSMGDGDHDFDIVFELGGQISQGQTDALKRRGARIVSYCCGPEYVQTMEAMIFRRRLGTASSSIRAMTRSGSSRRSPRPASTSSRPSDGGRRARAVRLGSDVPGGGVGRLPDGGEYRPRTTAKRLSVIEPNIDVMKFCLYPLLLAERAFRQAPEKIGFLHVTNADQPGLGRPGICQPRAERSISSMRTRRHSSAVSTPRDS